MQIEGRDASSATVDQPLVTQGDWVSDGGVVLEAAFAASIEAQVGDPVAVNGRSFTVVGLAVTAAMPPYPGGTCLVTVGCVNGAIPEGVPPGFVHNPGLVWLSRADVRDLAPAQDSVSYVMNLRIADPDDAEAFVAANIGDPDVPLLFMQTRGSILADATELAEDSQILLLIGAWLLGLLAVATLSVLVGGRLADQHRRVGLLRAVGGTPGLVAAVLLAEYLLVAVAAAVGGLAVGALTAPLLVESGAGLVGSAGTPSMTVSTVAVVIGVALGVAVLATAVPAVRGARVSTVRALADAARPPHRAGRLIAVSSRLPVPLLLALRVAARRPRRVVLGVVSIAVTVSGIYVLLVLDSVLGALAGTGAYTEAQVAVLRHVLLLWTVTLLCLASLRSRAGTAAGPRSPRRGSCSPWCWRPCWWWRRSPLFLLASADAVL